MPGVLGDEKKGIGVTDGCELPCQCWELNPFPMQEQALLTAGPSSLPCMLFVMREVE